MEPRWSESVKWHWVAAEFQVHVLMEITQVKEKEVHLGWKYLV